MPRSPRAVHPSTALITDALASQHPKPKRPAVRAKTTKAKVIPIRPDIQMPISFTVMGVPQPKGSKSIQYRNGRAVMIEGTINRATAATRRRSRELVQQRYDWFELVELEAMAIKTQMLDGPLQLAAKFWFPCGKNDVPGSWHTKKPDCDKLARGIFDAATKAGAIRDDARIANMDGTHKRYCRVGESPRVEIEIIPLRDPIDMEQPQ